MPETELTFACPLCGQQFPWKPEYTGRKLACACGNLLTIKDPPQTAPQTIELRDDPSPTAIPIAPLDEPPPGQLHLDAAGQEIRPPRPPKVLGYRRIGSVEALQQTDETQARIRDVWVPLALIAISIILMATLAYLQLQNTPNGGVEIVGRLAFRAIWDTAMTLVAGMVIYWTVDAGLGEFKTGIVKLIAIALFRFSVSALIGYNEMLIWSLLGLLLTFPLMIFLFSYLFEFDFTESLFCSVLMTFMRLISYFGLWRVL